MKYILINDIQRISKKIDMPQNGIVFHVSMWWVTKNIEFDFYWLVIFLKGREIIYIYTNFYLQIVIYIYLFYFIFKKKSSRYHGCSNVWNSEDSDAF